MPAYLVGRVADPLLGISTGIFAYYLWEYDPRNEAQRPEGRKLIDLARRRWGSNATTTKADAAELPAAQKVVEHR